MTFGLGDGSAADAPGAPATITTTSSPVSRGFARSGGRLRIPATPVPWGPPPPPDPRLHRPDRRRNGLSRRGKTTHLRPARPHGVGQVVEVDLDEGATR